MVDSESTNEISEKYNQLKKKYDILQSVLSKRLYNLGDKFFEKIVEKLNNTIEADYTFVGKLSNSKSIDTLVLYGNGQLLENMSYNLLDTPCEDVIGKTACCYPQEVTSLFPKDDLLIQMGIEGYIGVPLFNSQKKANGILVSLFKEPIKDPQLTEMILLTHATQAGAELQHQIIYEELKKAQTKIEESEQKYRLMVSSSPDTIVVLDHEGKVNFISENIKELTGYEPSYFHNKGIPVNNIFQEDLEHYSSTIKKFLAGEENVNMIYRFRTKNEKTIWLQHTGGPVYANGIQIGTQSNLRDITLEKELEHKLIAAKEKAETTSKLKTAFLQNMSHEIRTPLNAISGFAGLMNNDKVSPEKRKGYVQIIQNSSKQLLDIISDILTISSLETKQEKYNETEVNINELIIELFAIFKQQATHRNISLFAKKELSDENSFIRTDKTKLTQVLSNLLSNALKFTNKGQIEFGYTCEQNELRFFVKDTGIGINKDNLEDIFERFRQADNDISLHYGGTGLGLSISKGFVELLGGTIRVDSQPNLGSNFHFTIPYTPTNASASQHSFTPIDQKKNTILVVEDEEYNFFYLEELLLNNDTHLLHAKDGEEAIQLFRENPQIDLTLMDIKIPKLSGEKAALKIRELSPNAIIIAQSAYALEHEVEKYAHIFNAYLTKPIKQEVLAMELDKYLK